MNLNNSPFRATLSLCLVFGAAAVGAPIAPPDPSGEIVVTATRAARDIQSVPASIVRLDAEAALHGGGARTLPDLLAGLPSTLLQKTSQGQSSPFLRGFTGFRTLFLIDGVRLNNAVFRDGPNQYWGTVDPYSIRGGELLLGPASVLYGSDAVGGTFHAFPREVPDWTGQPAWDRQLLYRGDTADRSHTGRLQLGARLDEQWGFTGGYTVRDFQDLRGGHRVGRQKKTGYEEQDFDARLDYTPDTDTRLSLVHQSVDQQNAWRTHKTLYGIDWEGLAVGDENKHAFDQHRDLSYIKFVRENMGGPVDRMNWTLSRQLQREDRDRIKADNARDKQGFEVESWGTTLQMESDSRLGRWVYGFQYDRDRVDSYTDKYKADGRFDKRGIQGPVADNARYESAGFFVEDTIRLANGLWDLVPGLRYTRSRADADRVQDPVTGDVMGMTGDWDALTGSLRLLLPLAADRRHVLFGGVSQGFRAPNLSDLTRLDSARSNEIETPVSDLDSETFVAYEIGLKSRTERLTARLGYYYTTLDRMIVRTPTGRLIDGDVEVTKRNSGDGYIQGIEWAAMVSLSSTWSTWLNASWMEGKVDAYPTSDAVRKRDFVSRLMPPTAELGLRWKREDGKYWAECGAVLADKADKLSADDKRDTQRIPPGGTPGYAVFALRTGAKVAQNLDVALAFENLFDEDYRIHGSGVNEPGRHLVVSAICRF